MSSLYLELLRVRSVKKPRKDWPVRWYAAAAFVKYKGVFKTDKKTKGRMMAKPNSPIWKALSKGVGGFDDAIGSGEPPFAINSGLGWQKVKVEEKEEKKEEESVKDRIKSYMKNAMTKMMNQYRKIVIKFKI